MSALRKVLIKLETTLMLMVLFTATGCGQTMDMADGNSQLQETAAPSSEQQASETEGLALAEPMPSEYVQGEELLCLCDSEEEAEKIAGMYGIELVKFEYGVATFHAEDPQSVIDMGKEKGYPELELNGIMHTF